MQPLEALNQLVEVLRTKADPAVVILYDEFSACFQATELLLLCLPPLPPLRKRKLQTWQFSGLRFPSLRRQAVQDAAGADIVCVAARGENKLPECMQDWAKQWATNKGGQRSLLLVLLPDLQATEPVANRTVQFLREVSGLAGADFILAPLSLCSQLTHEFQAA